MTKRYDIRYRTDPDMALQALTKTDDGKEVQNFEIPFKPYCFVLAPDDAPADNGKYVATVSDTAVANNCDIEGTRETHVDGERQLMKVEGRTPWDIRDFQRALDYETFEADVPYARRVMIDEDILVDVPEPEDILYFDIEVDPRGEFPDPEEASAQVLSIAWADGVGNEGFICYDEEKRVFHEFFDLLDDYYVLSGWNSETFDWPYLKNRMEKFGLYYDTFEIVHLDLQYLFMHVNREERQSFALDAVGADEVGMEKTMSEEDHPMGYEVLWHWFQNDRETLEEYNVEDTRIVRELDKKYRLTYIVFRICRRGYTRPSQLMYNTDSGQVNMATGKACDSAILQENDDRRFNNRGKYRDLHDFPGGRVFEPIPGRYTDVMTADFSGMYPAIIRDFNIGIRSWIDEEDIDDAVARANAKFDEDISEDDLIRSVGVDSNGAYTTEGQMDNVGKASGYFVHPDIEESEIARSLDGIESLRKEFKSQKKSVSKGTEEWHKFNNIDRGLKVLANTFFGVGASPVHRFYEPGMSENITEVGQHLTSACKIWAEDNLDEVVKVIYGDTDSVMFELDTEDADVDMSEFDEYVADFIDEVGPDNDLDMDIDDLRNAYITIKVAQRTADKLNDFVVEYVQDVFNSPGENMEMDLDDVWIRYLITDKKKKYSGHVVYDDGPCAYHKTKGFKCEKADTCDAVVSYQKDLITARLWDEPCGPIIDDYKARLFNGEFDLQMVKHTRLNKMPDDYETLMAHARAAKMIQEREDDDGAIRTGDKIAYLKYDDDTTAVMPADKGIEDFRPNERYCPTCDEVVWEPEDHPHETDDGPRLRRSHYSYLWDNRFKQTIELLKIDQQQQSTLGSFA